MNTELLKAIRLILDPFANYRDAWFQSPRTQIENLLAIGAVIAVYWVLLTDAP